MAQKMSFCTANFSERGMKKDSASQLRT